MNKHTYEQIGNVVLDLSYYNGQDLYNEGDEVEEKVLQTVSKYDDYTEVLAEDNRWPILYQLSRRRECIVDPMDIKGTDDVLEIGSGMGAVTGAIARKCKAVDCIELSKRRSLANAHRNKHLDNIRIFVGNFQDIVIEKKYDVITLIGVLEYAQAYMKNDETPYESFLKKVANCLKPNGKLYIAIENKLGMKYFAGSSEDHLGIPFVGIEGYKAQDQVKTFSRSQLIDLVIGCGFESTYFYYPYPDYKLPTIIFSDDYMPNDSFVPVISNYDMDRLVCFDEKKAYRSLIGTDEMKMLANSFLVEAVKKFENDIC